MARVRFDGSTPDDIRQRVYAALDAAAIVIQQEAKTVLSRAGTGVWYSGQPARSSAPGEPPVAQTGTLRRSVQIDRTENKGRMPFVRVGTNLEYGPYLEFGTSRMAPRPWLRPAVAASRPRVRAIMEDIL